MELEHPLLKVPVEELQRGFRSTKRRVDRELDAVIDVLVKAGRALPPPPAPTSAGAVVAGRVAGAAGAAAGVTSSSPSPPPPRPQPSAAQAAAASAAATAVRAAAERLRGLGPRLADAATTAAATMVTLERRLVHITAPEASAPKHGPRRPQNSVTNVVPSPEMAARRTWERVRLARFIVDYLVRRGHPALAARLAADAGVLWLVDLDVHAKARTILDALEARDPQPLLDWCATNERRLVKSESMLELRARTQVFVELVRSQDNVAAIAYAKKHIAPGCLPHAVPRLLRTMALLAMPPDTTVAPYAEMYAPERWGELADAFREDYYALNGLAQVPVVETAVKAGLASLKTRYCAGEPQAPLVMAGDGVTLVRENVDCPTCNEPYRRLAAELPYAFHLHSSLVCALSRRPMDDDNLPLMLPNGNVYSHLAISMAAMRGKGIFTDPRTGDTYEYPQTTEDGRGSRDRIRRVYVM
ncbi:hypothetical protein MMPV_001559 [Pyropia vietnamensis]